MIDIAPEVIPQIPGREFVTKIRQFHDRIWNNWRFLKAQLILEGNRITGIATVAGIPLEIAHKLDHIPLGYWVTRSIGPTAIAVTEAGAAPTETTLTLTPSAAGTIDLYVF